MAFVTATGVFQIISGVCDADALIRGPDSLLKRLVPGNNERLYGFILADLEKTSKTLDILADVVEKKGTMEHKRQFHHVNNIYLGHSQDLKHLEDRLEETGRSKKWLTIFQLDLDPLRTDLKALRERVLVNQQRTTKSSKQIQDELRGIGIVTMPMEESSAFASTTSARTGAESLDTAASTQSSPAEVQIFKLDLPNENNTIGSNTSGVPICRVGSTESWYVGEMKGAIPLKKWKKQISDVLAANSPSPPIS